MCAYTYQITCSNLWFIFLHSAQSTITNKSRLKLLHKREEVLQQIFSAVREPSTPLHKQSGRYEQFLEGIIAESFLQIMEPGVTIHCRRSDVEVVKKSAENASNTFKDLSGRDINFEVQGSINDDVWVHWMCQPSGSWCLYLRRSQGGVKLISSSGRITLDNTLEERLRLLEDKVLAQYFTTFFADFASRCYQKFGRSCLVPIPTASFIHNSEGISCTLLNTNINNLRNHLR